MRVRGAEGIVAMPWSGRARHAYLQERFAGWPYDLPALFARTPSERIRDRAYRSTPRSWFDWGMRDQYGYDPGALVG